MVPTGMTQTNIPSDRFNTEPGFRLTVQVPEARVHHLVNAIRTQDPLSYGDYEAVSFRTAAGVQQFRSLGGGRNIPNDVVDDVPCVELSVFLPDDTALVGRVIEAVYNTHPYEEPVIFVTQCQRTTHIRGQDEDNPNRFWNAPAEDWLPKKFR